MKLSTVTWLLLLAVSLALQLHQQHTGTGPDNTQH